MQFSAHDKVMHPKYGPGEITGVEHRELVDGFEHYFVIELLTDGSTLYVPMRMMDELGVRPAMSRAKLTHVLNTLRSTPRRLPKDFKERQMRIREKLATARPVKMAEVVRDLTGLRRRKRLTKVDKDLLKRGRELLAAEIATVTDTAILDAHATMDAAMRVAVADKFDQSRRTPVTGLTPTSMRQALVRKLIRRVRTDEGQSSNAQAQGT